MYDEIKNIQVDGEKDACCYAQRAWYAILIRETKVEKKRTPFRLNGPKAEITNWVEEKGLYTVNT